MGKRKGLDADSDLSVNPGPYAALFRNVSAARDNIRVASGKALILLQPYSILSYSFPISSYLVQ